MLNKEPLYHRVAEHIISKIAHGIYLRGKCLPPERNLCNEFGVSRGTLRKGLAELQQLGIVAIRHGSGCRVNKLRKIDFSEYSMVAGIQNHVSLNDIIVARKTIELAAASLAAKLARTSTVRQLESLLRRMRSITNFSQLVALDMSFHRTLVSASKNQVLLAAFDAIQSYHKYSQIFTSYGEREREQTLEHHHQILTAFKRGHEDRLIKALRQHLDSMQRYDSSYVKSQRYRMTKQRVNGNKVRPAKILISK